MKKTYASLSLDLDNQWAYMRGHGLSEWQSYPTYLPHVVPIVLDTLEKLDIKATVFVVGKDADIDVNGRPLRLLVDSGFSIGNHSFLHEPWMHRNSSSEIGAEISRAHDSIRQATGIEPISFRGPGFAISGNLLRELQKLGYKYDASVFPTIIGPLARAVYFRSADLSETEKNERKDQFGSFADGLLPLKPFRWDIDNSYMLEFPVTTVPIARVPFHFTYVHYLGQKSKLAAKAYFAIALALCRAFRVSPSILLHPLDFIAADEVPELSNFPGIGHDSAAKRQLTLDCLSMLNSKFDVLELDEFAARYVRDNNEQDIPSRVVKD